MIELIEWKSPDLAPLAPEIGAVRILNRPLRECLAERLATLTAVGHWRVDFWPEAELLAELSGCPTWEVVAGNEIVAASAGTQERRRFEARGQFIRYPWDVLALNERLVAELDSDRVEGRIYPSATVEGHIVLGEGSRILPGVFIEGNVVIGRDCKIGPNAYLRGNTVIGDRCHVGQAVEIKNSVLGDRVSVGHLSYVGDTVMADNVNFGAGTIIGNLRHDGANHRSMVGGRLVSTGRRKFGSVIGSGVHTGIHTVIYPGRKLGCGVSTRPGAVVDRDLE